MVTTRSQDKGPEPQAGDKRSHSKAAPAKAESPDPKQQKTESSAATEAVEGGGHNGEETADAKETTSDTKISELISKYGELPLSETDLRDPEKPTPDTVLALLLNAMLSSTRISHSLAAKTVALVIKTGYHKVDVLKKSTWQERTEVLTEGGYTHYREKTATMMGDLAALIEEIYDSDLNSILGMASEDPAKIRAELKHIKGLGDVGINIFFDTAQHIWPCLAPYVDPRSMKTAKYIGIGGDVETLWEAVSKKPDQMCRLAAALTKVRLDAAEKEFQG
ncbi:Uu.00g131180.m01.CDS01 [Anthostomella pinea]|uniref:Uu.00g131180.m01.CDS01 n=1 Tax=Anthostomella pinea TaxID=933095 RepID=A0AAI8VJY3_9PEZI|nr:Uu.00g131180.m01.CDS01 [Anthostomella pinea]